MAFSQAIVLSLVFGVLCTFFWTQNRKAVRLPPGPLGYPLVGNVYDFPRTQPSRGFEALCKRYGDAISVSILGRRIIVFNTQDLANEVLGKKGESSAGRPILPMAADLAGYDRFLALTQPGERHKEGRRFLQQAIGSRRAAQQYAPAQEAEMGRYLRKLLSQPEGFMEHSKWIVGTSILLFTYGYKTLDYNDPLIQATSAAMKRYSDAATPGRWLVDIIPILKYVPSWVPGASFKRIAAADRIFARDTFEKPYIDVKKQVASDSARPSLVASYLQERGGTCSKEEEEFIIFTAGDLYGAGLDTMTSAIEAFFLAMVLYPSLQARAQAEIDSVCGNGARLPVFTDKSKLPFIEALLTEVLRWTIITPMGLPHRFTKDEYHGEYLFPKDAYAFANIGVITQDPAVYPDPHIFDPTRFIGPRESRQRDPRETVFGFGRRQCPGEVLAEQVMFLIIASTLATFTIGPKEGEEYSLDYTDEAISHRLPFRCEIRVRSAQARSLILEV